MFPPGIFWCGCCYYCCDRGKKSQLLVSPKTEVWTSDWSLTISNSDNYDEITLKLFIVVVNDFAVLSFAGYCLVCVVGNGGGC